MITARSCEDCAPPRPPPPPQQQHTSNNRHAQQNSATQIRRNQNFDTANKCKLNHNKNSEMKTNEQTGLTKTFRNDNYVFPNLCAARRDIALTEEAGTLPLLCDSMLCYGVCK
jgi:hypothetical protein